MCLCLNSFEKVRDTVLRRCLGLWWRRLIFRLFFIRIIGLSSTILVVEQRQRQMTHGLIRENLLHPIRHFRNRN